MKGSCLLTIWYTIGLAIASNEVLMRRTNGKRLAMPGSPGPSKPKRERTRSPSPPDSGFSMTRSSSADSWDATSMKTKVSGPGYVNVDKAPFDLKVGERTQYTQKGWSKDVLSSRASLRPMASQSYHGAEVIAKGTQVKARMDTTRGGTGYIRTNGVGGYKRTEVEPGNVVIAGATSTGDIRARMKAKLIGAGTLHSKSVYRDDSKSLSMSTAVSSANSQPKSGPESASEQQSVLSGNGKSRGLSGGQSVHKPKRLRAGSGGFPSGGESGNDQSRRDLGSKPSKGSDVLLVDGKRGDSDEAGNGAAFG